MQPELANKRSALQEFISSSHNTKLPREYLIYNTNWIQLHERIPVEWIDAIHAQAVPGSTEIPTARKSDMTERTMLTCSNDGSQPRFSLTTVHLHTKKKKKKKKKIVLAVTHACAFCTVLELVNPLSRESGFATTERLKFGRSALCHSWDGLPGQEVNECGQ